MKLLDKASAFANVLAKRLLTVVLMSIAATLLFGLLSLGAIAACSCGLLNSWGTTLGLIGFLLLSPAIPEFKRLARLRSSIWFSGAMLSSSMVLFGALTAMSKHH